MRYCSNCGSELRDNADVCLNCGKSVNDIQSVKLVRDDTGGFGLWCLGFMIPVVGLILYLVWKDDKPLSAKSAGQGALFSVGIIIAIYILIFLLALSGAY